MSKLPPVANQVPLTALFQLMADRIPGVVWATDTELRFTASFGAGLAALGLRSSEVVGKTIFEYYRTADEAAQPISAHRRALQGETVEGEQIWQDRRYRFQLEPLRNDAGVVSGCIGFAQDITEQAIAANALRASEERFRRVFDEGPLGVVLADLEVRIQRVNSRFCTMLGYSEQEVIELGLRGITHPEDWEKDRQLGESLVRGEIQVYCIEKRYLRKDGEVIWGQLTVSMMRDSEGKPTAIIGLVADVTERKRGETLLRESERSLTTLLGNLPGAAYRCRADANWTIEFLSDGYHTLTGYPTTDRIGRPGTCHAELIHPDDRQREFDVMQRAIAERRQFQVEYRLLAATGEEKWVWEQGVGIFSENGELEAIEGFTTDVTKGKRAESELRASEAALVRSRDELEHRVAERTAELEEANRLLKVEIGERQQAEEKLQQEREALLRMLRASDRDRELITYDIHDGVAQRLLGALMQFEACEQVASYESERVKAMFAAGLQGLREASAEARSLMNRTRTPVLQKFGIKAAIADVIDNISERPNAPEVMYRCEVEFSRLTPDIENAIFRVAQEAITNAVRHSTSETVRVSLVQDGDEVTLEVQDRGIGFDATKIVAGRFGLDGIRERARAFGKRFQLDSAPGQGTRIRATFPVLELDRRSLRGS